MRPPRLMNLAGEAGFTGITGPLPNKPPNESSSPTALPMAGITRTAVDLLLIIPMAASSAMIAEMISAEVSPGMLIISRPTEHTAVRDKGTVLSSLFNLNIILHYFSR